MEGDGVEWRSSLVKRDASKEEDGGGGLEVEEVGLWASLGYLHFLSTSLHRVFFFRREQGAAGQQG